MDAQEEFLTAFGMVRAARAERRQPRPGRGGTSVTMGNTATGEVQGPRQHLIRRAMSIALAGRPDRHGIGSAWRSGL
jgi:hypothetical protein